MRLPFATDAWVWGLLPAAVVFVAVGIDRNYQTDLWHHLARGRLIVAEGRLVDDDRFSCTVPGRPFQDSNWGWQVGMVGLYRLGGLALVQAANAVTAGATLALLTVLCRRRGGAAIGRRCCRRRHEVFFGPQATGRPDASPDGVLPPVRAAGPDPRGIRSATGLACPRSPCAGGLGQLPRRFPCRPGPRRSLRPLAGTGCRGNARSAPCARSAPWLLAALTGARPSPGDAAQPLRLARVRSTCCTSGFRRGSRHR